MKPSGNFITLGRAIFAFPITMLAGAMAFFPASIIFVRQAPDALAVHGNFPHLAGILIFEIFWAPIGALIFSLYVLPFYAAGLLIARRLRIRNCLYFLLFGCVLSLCLRIWVFNQAAPHTPYAIVFPVDLSVGIVSGFACWASLHLTQRWSLHKSVVTIR